MTVFNVIIEEPEQLVGLAAARDAYNANPERDEDGKPIRYASDAAFVQFLISRTADKYAREVTS